MEIGENLRISGDKRRLTAGAAETVYLARKDETITSHIFWCRYESVFISTIVDSKHKQISFYTHNA
jgi:hypothetical protein